jgi:hypothetical protein
MASLVARVVRSGLHAVYEVTAVAGTVEPEMSIYTIRWFALPAAALLTNCSFVVLPFGRRRGFGVQDGGTLDRDGGSFVWTGTWSLQAWSGALACDWRSVVSGSGRGAVTRDGDSGSGGAELRSPVNGRPRDPVRCSRSVARGRSISTLLADIARRTALAASGHEPSGQGDAGMCGVALAATGARAAA